MLNWFDIVVAIALIISFFNGLQKGLVLQLFNLAGLLIAIVFAGQAANYILPWLIEITGFALNVASVLSYIISFGLIMALAGLVGAVINNFLKAINLNFLNKLLGGVASIAISIIILSLILNLVLMIDTKRTIIKDEVRENSFFYEHIRVVVPLIVPYLDKDIWEERIPELKEKIEKKRENKSLETIQTYLLIPKNIKTC